MKNGLLRKIGIGIILPLAFAGIVGSGCSLSRVFTQELDERAFVNNTTPKEFFNFTNTLNGCAISINVDSSKVSYYFPKDLNKKQERFIKRKSFNFLIPGDIFEQKQDGTEIVYDVRPYLSRDPISYQLERALIDHTTYFPTDSLAFNKLKDRMSFLMDKYYSLKDSVALKSLK